MMMRRAALMLVSTVLLSGCVKLGGKAPAQLLSLTATAQQADDATRNVERAELISISLPFVSQALAQPRVAVSQGAVVTAYVKDGAWSEAPARMFREVLAQTVQARSNLVVIDPRQIANRPGRQVSGHLRAFQIDADKQQAHVIYDALMIKGDPGVVTTRRFEAWEPVSAIEPVPSGVALNKAANVIAGEVAAWVASQ